MKQTSWPDVPPINQKNYYTYGSSWKWWCQWGKRGAG